jgi:hypothetical protein
MNGICTTIIKYYHRSTMCRGKVDKCQRLIIDKDSVTVVSLRNVNKKFTIYLQFIH